MILGVGVDLCDARRIKEVLARHPERFVSRVFTKDEQALCDARGASRAESYAKRWAGKEACAKALGVGIAQGLAWTDIEITPDALGRPHLRLEGAAQNRLEAMTPEGKAARLHISLSDEPPLAQAFVVIEAL